MVPLFRFWFSPAGHVKIVSIPHVREVGEHGFGFVLAEDQSTIAFGPHLDEVGFVYDVVLYCIHCSSLFFFVLF